MELQNMSSNKILKIIIILSVSRLGKTDPLLTPCTTFLLFLFLATFFLASMTRGLMYLFNHAVRKSEGTASNGRRARNLLEKAVVLIWGTSFLTSWNNWGTSQTFSRHFYRSQGQHLNPESIEYDLGLHDAVDRKLAIIGLLSPRHGASSGCGWRMLSDIDGGCEYTERSVADSRKLSSMGVGRGANKSSPFKINMLWMKRPVYLKETS